MVNGLDDFERSEKGGVNRKQGTRFWAWLRKLTERAFVRRIVRNEWR